MGKKRSKKALLDIIRHGFGHKGSLDTKTDIARAMLKYNLAPTPKEFNFGWARGIVDKWVKAHTDKERLAERRKWRRKKGVVKPKSLGEEMREEFVNNAMADGISPSLMHADIRRQTEAETFYSSGAWRRVRFEVLKEQGRECACCGATPGDGVRMHVDHVEPRSKRPDLSLDKSNLQVLCEDCNLGKMDRCNSDFRPT